ncbi:MAG: PAS domain S-box protein, partial [Geopsychrobacter sp.]|nr:PAS domain S-box protein [Geopsychrobacter sp.]
MPSNIKLKLQVVDRVGAMAQIAMALADHDLNIIAMEVETSAASTCVFLDLGTSGESPDPQTVLAILQAIPNIHSVATIRTLPQERREKRFQVVLDSISDGILSINEEGELTTINRVARRMLGYQQENLTGRDLTELNLADTSLLDCLNGKSYRNVKRSLT